VVDVAPIVAWLRQHPTSRVHHAAFNSYDPLDAARFFDDTARVVLGGAVAAVLDYHAGQVVVACVALSDGRRVSLKLYPPEYESPVVLAACREVQRQAAGRGVPAPEPMALAKTHLGLVAVDAYVSGERRACQDGQPRIALATLLAELIDACPDADDVVALRQSRLARHPADISIDADTPPELAATIKRLAPPVEAAPRDTVVHLDWRIQNVAWSFDQIVAIYDWDSITTTAEAIAVGCAAGMFSYDFRDAVPHVPTPDEVVGFIHDYPRPIDLAVARAAAGLKMLGYSETERRLDPAGVKLGPRSYRTALAGAFDAYTDAFGP
jgi:hypothetical protein